MALEKCHLAAPKKTEANFKAFNGHNCCHQSLHCDLLPPLQHNLAICVLGGALEGQMFK